MTARRRCITTTIPYVNARPHLGFALELVQADTLADADDLAVAFNPAYLLEALNSFDASQVRFELLGPGRRALLRGVPDEDDAAREDHRHLLISVRQLR
jgi:DNA polymerase III sliding clamp (beta) subunit (PCNA family)